jgi:hypothetical protein
MSNSCRHGSYRTADREETLTHHAPIKSARQSMKGRAMRSNALLSNRLEKKCTVEATDDATIGMIATNINISDVPAPHPLMRRTVLMEAPAQIFSVSAATVRPGVARSGAQPTAVYRGKDIASGRSHEFPDAHQR